MGPCFKNWILEDPNVSLQISSIVATYDQLPHQFSHCLGTEENSGVENILKAKGDAKEMEQQIKLKEMIYKIIVVGCIIQIHTSQRMP